MISRLAHLDNLSELAHVHLVVICRSHRAFSEILNLLDSSGSLSELTIMHLNMRHR
jgi:hypothetical protein